jgi:xylulokinase
MSTQYFALLDIGGTDLKSAIVQVGSKKLEDIKRRPTPSFISQVGLHWEIDPAELLGACKELLEGLKTKERNFSGLLVSGQMGGWLLTDEDDLPLTNLVSWQDLRSERRAEDGLTFSQKAEQTYGLDWIKGNGNEMRPGLPAVGLFEHFEEHKPSDAPMRFHSIISWVVAALSKEYVFSVHSTDVASSGLYLIHKKAFAKNVLSILRAKLIMPEVKEDIHFVGFSNSLGCPVYSAVGDQQSSLFGAGLNNESTVVNIGTGGQVARLVRGTPGEFAQVRPYFFRNYIVTRTHLPSGRALTAFLQALRAGPINDSDFEWMSQSALEHEPGSARDAVNFEEEIRQLKSVPTAETNEVTASAFIHAVVQRYVEALAQIGHRQEDSLLFAGGVGQKMKALSILIGEMTKSKVIISQTDETTLQGLANLSLFL